MYNMSTLLNSLQKWRTQIRKGYLELCILQLIESQDRLYGVEVLSSLKKENIEVKEGTLYPLLNRLVDEKLLESQWQMPKGGKGHPRKFYQLSSQGKKQFSQMRDEFFELQKIFLKLTQNTNVKNIERKTAP